MGRSPFASGHGSMVAPFRLTAASYTVYKERVPGLTTYERVNVVTGGRLPDLLAKWRDAGDSYETIARRIYDLHGIDVSYGTVRRWVRPAETAATS